MIQPSPRGSVNLAESIFAEFTCMSLTYQGFCNALRCKDHGAIVTTEGGTAQGRGVSGITKRKIRAKDSEAPATTLVDDEGASTASGAGEGMARLLYLITDLKDDIGARLKKLETRRDEDDQASEVYVDSSNFCTYAEARTGLGRS
ncbi:hypothetical protein KXD40_004249 [Peronospora effusa]|nr:hypothetical protein KXD40_004249 [Peronospora effusa]